MTTKFIRDYDAPPRMFSLELIQEAMENDGGFCLDCGEPADGCEPDARRYECDACGERQVYGAEELLLMGRVK